MLNQRIYELEKELKAERKRANQPESHPASRNYTVEDYNRKIAADNLRTNQDNRQLRSDNTRLQAEVQRLLGELTVVKGDIKTLNERQSFYMYPHTDMHMPGRYYG